MKKRLVKIFVSIYKVIFKICGFFIPKDEKLIIFESFLGKQYSDNPRAIYEYLEKQEKDYKMYWSVDSKFVDRFKNLDIQYIQRFSLKWLVLMTRSKYWVTNSRLPLWIPKPRRTIYLQTWHGTPLKRLASDMDVVHMPGTTTEQYKQEFLDEVEKWDYLVSPNEYSTKIFTRAFQFNQTVIESGYPRNDFLINNNNEECILKFKKENNLPLDKKVILYAPTWRDDQFYSQGNYKLDIQLNLDKLNRVLGNDYIILLRLHYLIAKNLDFKKYDQFVLDYSDFEDINILYLISDILITDYSSVFFDYANLKRPILFYVYDIENYRDHLRGFYLNLEQEAPGPLLKHTNEIIEEIQNIEQNGFAITKTYQSFYDKFCYLEDGNASKRVVQKVFKNKGEI